MKIFVRSLYIKTMQVPYGNNKDWQLHWWPTING